MSRGLQMEYLAPVWQAHFIQRSSLQGHVLAKALLNGALESQILQAQILSGCSLLCNWLSDVTSMAQLTDTRMFISGNLI